MRHSQALQRVTVLPDDGVVRVVMDDSERLTVLQRHTALVVYDGVACGIVVGRLTGHNEAAHLGLELVAGTWNVGKGNAKSALAPAAAVPAKANIFS